MTKKATAYEDLARLHERRAALDAEQRELEAEHHAAGEKVLRLRHELARVVERGEDHKAAEEALLEAERTAKSSSWSARAHGIQARQQAADAAIEEHIERNWRDLTDALRPSAEEAVEGIYAVCRAVAEAIDRWHEVAAEFGELVRHKQGCADPTHEIPWQPRLDELAAAAKRIETEQIAAPIPRSAVRGTHWWLEVAPENEDDPADVVTLAGRADGNVG